MMNDIFISEAFSYSILGLLRYGLERKSMKNDEWARERRSGLALIEAKSNDQYKNNEEQAGSESEVWRLRQFFTRSCERKGLRLLPTSSSSAYH
jgi:hypothetical protein